MSVSAALLKEFILSLSGKAGTTVDAYQRELRNFLDWISQRAGNSGPFDAQQELTKTTLQSYLTHLQSEGHSVSHCARVKSAVGGFCPMAHRGEATAATQPCPRRRASASTASSATI
jgi:site-specific recombinase XerD